MSNYQYQNPLDVLDDYIDKLTRGIMPAAIDEITEKEIEIRMRELAAEVEDIDDADDEEINALISDAKELKAKVQETKRKATRKDIAIFTLSEETKAKIREEMSSSYVRKKPSVYNTDERTEKDNKEYMILKKRASKIRRCYYHPEDWKAAVDTLLDIVKYDRKNYPWLTEDAYYQAFWNGNIKLNCICPILYIDYHTPIKDPLTLLGIYKGEITIEEEPTFDPSERVKLKDDTISMVKVHNYTEAETDYMQDLASRGFDTPMNIIFKDSHKDLYARFMPSTKKSVNPERLRNYLSYLQMGSQVKDHDFKPFEEADIISYIHAMNHGTLNTALNSATTKWLTAISSPVQKTQLDIGIKSTDVVVNAEAAMREAAIMANIKSLSSMT